MPSNLRSPDGERAWRALQASARDWKAQGLRVESMAMQLIGLAARMLEKDYPQMAFAIHALMCGFQAIAEVHAREDSGRAE